MGENTGNHMSDRSLGPRVCKEHYINNKKTNKPIKEWAEDPIHFSREDIQMISGHVRREWASFIIKELKSKPL